MLSTLARWAYSTLLRAATPLYFARLWWRGAREPAYRQHWRERLGFTSAAIARGRLWIHAVSLGETRAAAALVDALRAQRPGLQLLLTHGTATGREAGAALLQDGDAQAWLPYDTPGAVRRFLVGHRPALGVLMETELWPNLLHSSRTLKVPMLLANARLSERSQRKGIGTADEVGDGRQVDRGLVRPGRPLPERGARDDLVEHREHDDEDGERKKTPQPAVDPVYVVAVAIGQGPVHTGQATTPSSLSQASSES